VISGGGAAWKPEIRIPKPERSPNAEIRTMSPFAVFSGFEFRISFGIRDSGFGFRISRRSGELSQRLSPESGKILFESGKFARKFRTR